MPRNVASYIRQFLNSSASATPFASTEPATGLPIGTGVQVGGFQEFSDAEALQYSSKAVVSVPILTAGSGQTNGTYTATASTGGAVISYTIAGGALTAVTIVTPGGPYTTAPTFTIAAGGTPGTVQAVIGVLYSGTYKWVQLDPAVVGTIAVGTALYWLQTATGYVVTNVAANAPDFAGVSIDPNFGASNPYAWMQANGKMQVLYASSGTVPSTYGDVIQITSAAAPTTFNAVAAGNANAAVGGLTVGYNLGAAQAVGSVGLIRNTRLVLRF
jgi:hypothetical protein